MSDINDVDAPLPPADVPHSKWIQTERVRRGWSYAKLWRELGGESGVGDRKNPRRWELDGVRPGRKSARRLVNLLGTPPADVLESLGLDSHDKLDVPRSTITIVPHDDVSELRRDRAISVSIIERLLRLRHADAGDPARIRRALMIVLDRLGIDDDPGFEATVERLLIHGSEPPDVPERQQSDKAG